LKTIVNNSTSSYQLTGFIHKTGKFFFKIQTCQEVTYRGLDEMMIKTPQKESALSIIETHRIIDDSHPTTNQSSTAPLAADFIHKKESF
jgi:hypothetical protein